jgi:hypothetical protein
MNTEWQREFRQRMRGFRDRQPGQQGEAVSIKLRVVSGLFSPRAFAARVCPD